MKKILAVAAFVAFAGPALAQTTAPSYPANPPLGTQTAPSGTVPSTTVAPPPERVAPDAAAAGNAEQTSKAVPNTGNTSGGPAKAAGQ